MSREHDCPTCGKPMEESPQCPGVWMCQDYRNPINDSPPYRYRCTGTKITEEAVEALDHKCMRILAERN